MEQVLWEGICGGEPLKVIAKSTETGVEIRIEPITEGFLTDLVGGAVTYAKAHPVLATIAVAPWAKMAHDAFKKYKLTKDTALKFYAKDQPERTKYFKMVKELEKTGQYKTVKSGYRGTGYYWELDRRNI